LEVEVVGGLETEEKVGEGFCVSGDLKNIWVEVEGLKSEGTLEGLVTE
jgi:hypothetical protein